MREAIRESEVKDLARRVVVPPRWSLLLAELPRP